MLVVTGLMRSGTSACTALCHQLGYVMGTSMLWPRMGSVQIEWEDYELGAEFAAALVGKASVNWNGIHDYVERRREHFDTIRELHVDGMVRGWGVKSPFLAPMWREFTCATATADERITWIVMRRKASEAYESLRRIGKQLRDPMKAKQLEEAQAGIEKALEDGLYDRADLVVESEKLRLHPERVASEILRAVRG